LYRGSYGWLIFWTILFFPIAVAFLIVKGIDVVEEKEYLIDTKQQIPPHSGTLVKLLKSRSDHPIRTSVSVLNLN